MEKRIKKSILIDCTILFDNLSGQSQGIYAKPFIHNLINEMLADEFVEWEIFLIGFNDLTQNLIEIGFSNFAIEEIKDDFEFITLGKVVRHFEFNDKLWKSIDNVVYEIEPDIFHSFNFLRGLPSNHKIRRSYTDLQTMVYIPNINLDFTISKFNLLRLMHFRDARIYKKMLDGVFNADKIIVPNKAVKEDLLKLDKTLASKIEIFYPGINKEFTTEKDPLNDEELVNLMQIYGLDPFKYIFFDYAFNDEAEIDSFVGVVNSFFKKKKYTEQASKLFLASKDFYKGSGVPIEPRSAKGKLVYEKLKAKGLLRYVVSAGILEDKDFVSILDHAAAYLHISRSHGFDFGPIQAISQGTPTFVDNTGVLATNMENYVNIINSAKPAKAAKEIFNIISNKDEVKTLGKKSRKAAKKYSWEGAVQRYVKLLKSVLEINTTV